MDAGVLNLRRDPGFYDLNRKGEIDMVSAKNRCRRMLSVIYCLVLVLGVAPVVGAQDKYPNPSRSIDLIIAFAPGGVTDVTGRIFADEFNWRIRKYHSNLLHLYSNY